MRRLTLLSLGLTLLLGCDEEVVLTCETDPARDCCEEFPDRPECVAPPTCEDDPTLPMCASRCDTDPLAPVCVPPDGRPAVAVEVIRDELGIAHIYAENDVDAFWASGYMQAVDRLGQMDIVRREVLGRQAEVFGPGRVDNDTLMRTLGLARWTALALDRARVDNPEEYALLIAWTQGVNARIAEIAAGDAPPPPSFAQLGYAPEPWAIEDGAAVGKLLLFGSANQLSNDILASVLRQYLPDVWTNVPLLTPLFDAFTVPQDERPMQLTFSPRLPTLPFETHPLPPDTAARFARLRAQLGTGAGRGSNNWAVAGRHTANGRPLVAGDPHQGLEAPSRFYAQHVHSASGRFDVAGWEFVGAPGTILGHNAHVAWTATLNYPDMMDLWDVTVAETSASLGGNDVPMTRRTETIEVAGGTPVTIDVLSIPGRGVILPDGIAPLAIGRAGSRLLFQWTGFAPTDDIGGVVSLNTATSVDAFEAAVDRMEIGSFNWVAGDAEDITYISSMWVPIRAEVSQDSPPYALLDGRDPNSLWTRDRVDRASLPRTRGTELGYVGTANNDPFGGTADGDPTNDPYYFGAFFDPGSRAARVYQELDRLIAEHPGAIDVADMETLQLDTHSLFADRLIPIFEDAWSRLPTDPALAEYRDRPELEALHDILTAWDRRMVRGSNGAVVFTGLLYFFAKAAIGDELTLAFQAILDEESVYLLKVPILAAEGAWDDSLALFQDGVPHTVLEALELTHFWITNVLDVTDPTTVTWDQIHCTRLDGRDGITAWNSLGCVPTDGGDGTVNVSSANILSDAGARDSHRSGSGPIYRMVATFGDDGVPEAYVTFVPGNVEDPTSPYWQSALDDWVEGRYRRFPFRRAEVEAAAAETFTLEP
ncbi:MAG: penicillin acylase family protein [Sandaracinaceae bacterium]